MKILMMALLLSLSIVVSAQVKITSPPDKKVEICKQTEVVASGEKKFRIFTSNDSVAYWIRSKFEHTVITRMTYDKKKDRSGPYWERSFYFNNEDWNDVVVYLNSKISRL
jgi:hypothetical protein